jgi:alpha-L-rhamnosidase
MRPTAGSRAWWTRRRVLMASVAASAWLKVDGTFASPAVNASLEAQFQDPPLSSAPWVYWMWLDSNVTRASVTADLEAMRAVGIGGAVVLDVLQGTPPGPMRYMDADWRDVFRHTVAEARRLGMEISFNNGAGYYGSGGPWIPPDKAMQVVVQSQTRVAGGRRLEIDLPRPATPGDQPPPAPWYADEPFTRMFGPPGADYRDIAVIALREAEASTARLDDVRFALSLEDGGVVPLPSADHPVSLSADRATVIILDFEQPWTVGVAELALGAPAAGWSGAIAVDEDGRWRDLCSLVFAPGERNASASFESVAGVRFRVTLRGPPASTASLVSLDLHARYRVWDPGQMKRLSWPEWNGYAGVESADLDATSPAGAATPLADVTDLTDRTDDQGRLTWQAPAGEWTILRIGHASKNRIVGPQRMDVAGLESDKLDISATRLHFDAMVAPLVAAVGPANASALRSVHIDSWEGGGQNWSAGMRDAFIRRRGYDPALWLPVLSDGRLLGDLRMTERFLWDVRRTVSELSVENYWRPMQQMAHGAGLRLSAESYTTIGDDLDASNCIDEPMAEFWKQDGGFFGGFANTPKMMASAAHLNGRPIVAAEAFTSIETERWREHPGSLKALGDRMLAKGVNRFVFHRCSAQRFPNLAPGLQMGPWGVHYETTQTWWSFSGPWHLYLTRCQHLLRQGRPVVDVLRLQPEEPLHRFEDRPIVGYDYDACGPDMFRQASAQDGEIVFPSGARYRLLVLDHAGVMTLDALRRVADIVRSGVALLGEPPRATPGLTNYPRADAALRALAREIWGDVRGGEEHSYGAGRVFRGVTPEAALAALDLAPDFESDADVAWRHRRIDGRDVYFVANAANADVLVNAIVRVRTGRCSLWDAETGSIRSTALLSPTPDGRTRVCFHLAASSTLFVVLEPDGAPRILAIEGAEGLIFRDGEGGAALATLIRADPSAAGDYVVRRSDGGVQRFSVAAPIAPVPARGPWEVRFPSGLGAPRSVRLDSLRSLSLHPDPGVAHFSGIAVYRTVVRLARAAARAERLILDLGRVEVAARVRLNGQDLGVVWRAPYVVDLTASAVVGENQLEIEVANLWANRLIGDEALPEDAERFGGGEGDNSRNAGALKVWPQWVLHGRPSPTGRISFSTWRLYAKDDPLPDSGLLGPVFIIPCAALPAPL